MPWSLCDAFDDHNDTLICWQTLFLEVADNHASVTEYRVKKVKQPDWFSEDMKQAFSLRDKYADINDFHNWRYWQNKVTELVNNTKNIQLQKSNRS